MHGLLVLVGMLLVLIIVVHIIFRVIKFTIGITILGIALIVVLHFFHHYLGINLMEPPEKTEQAPTRVQL